MNDRTTNKSAKVKSVPNTAIVQSRCDLRSIATIAEFYARQGEYISSMSLLIKMIIEDFKDILVGSNVIEELPSTVDAMEILARLGIEKGVHSGGRQKRTYIHQLMREDNVPEAMALRTPMDDIRRTTKSQVDTRVKELRKVAEQLEPDVRKYIEDKEKLNKNDGDDSLREGLPSQPNMSRIPSNLIANENENEK